jgi:hypothetical protein
LRGGGKEVRRGEVEKMWEEEVTKRGGEGEGGCGEEVVKSLYFNLVQLITTNRFIIKKIKDTMTHTHTLHIYLTLKIQTMKTNNLFKVAPVIFYSSNSSLFTI